MCLKCMSFSVMLKKNIFFVYTLIASRYLFLEFPGLMSQICVRKLSRKIKVENQFIASHHSNYIFTHTDYPQRKWHNLPIYTHCCSWMIYEKHDYSCVKNEDNVREQEIN